MLLDLWLVVVDEIVVKEADELPSAHHVIALSWCLDLVAGEKREDGPSPSDVVVGQLADNHPELLDGENRHPLHTLSEESLLSLIGFEFAKEF